jgi:tetratricopeptide (TPR) repeat protein
VLGTHFGVFLYIPNKLSMRKPVLFFCINALFICHISAQFTTIDKNKVLDFFQNQQFDEAIDYLLPVASMDSDNLQLLGFLGYANFMNEDMPVAEKYYKRIFGIDSNNLAANQYLAIINSNSNPDKAKMFTARLINIRPNKASYYRNMADLLRRKNQKDSALLYYNRAYNLSPNDYKNATGLADALIDNKRFSRADSILEIGLVKDSLSIPHLKLRIRSAYEAKDYQNALVPGERLIRLDEISLSSLTQLALSYYNLKMYNDCIRVCEYLVSKDLASESIYYYEARAWAKLKDYAKSNELLQTCLASAISKTGELYYYNLAENYEAINQFKKAVSQYDTAFYLFKNPLMMYNCGRIYESELKNVALARKYYAKYLALAKPQSPDEKKAYEYVRTRWSKKK